MLEEHHRDPEKDDNHPGDEHLVPERRCCHQAGLLHRENRVEPGKQRNHCEPKCRVAVPNVCEGARATAEKHELVSQPDGRAADWSEHVCRLKIKGVVSRQGQRERV